MNALLAVILSTNSTHPTPQYDDRTYRLYVEPSNYEDVVILQNEMFKKIFKKRKYELRSKLPFVKICYGKRCIYRKVELANKYKYKSGIVALTYKSIGELTNISRNGNADRANLGDCVKISEGCWLGYYLNHPNSATRISFLIGMPSLLIGMVSLIVSILSIWK